MGCAQSAPQPQQNQHKPKKPPRRRISAALRPYVDPAASEAPWYSNDFVQQKREELARSPPGSYVFCWQEFRCIVDAADTTDDTKAFVETHSRLCLCIQGEGRCYTLPIETHSEGQSGRDSGIRLSHAADSVVFKNLSELAGHYILGPGRYNVQAQEPDHGMNILPCALSTPLSGAIMTENVAYEPLGGATSLIDAAAGEPWFCPANFVKVVL